MGEFQQVPSFNFLSCDEPADMEEFSSEDNETVDAAV